MIPLHRHPALRSRDRDEAFASIKSRQPGLYNFRPRAGRLPWGIDVNFLALDHLRITSTRSSAYDISSEPDGFVRIFVPTGTDFQISYGSREISYSKGGALWTPTGAYKAHFHDGFQVLLTTLSADIFITYLQHLGFTGNLPKAIDEVVNGHALQIFRQQLMNVLNLIDTGVDQIISEERFRKSYAESLSFLLARTLLQENNSSKDFGKIPLRRALDFIDYNCEDEISALDIAHAAGVSLRNLQAQFASSMQTTISKYLLTVRLLRAHAHLLSPSHESSVTSIAHESGFNHMGEFSRAYQLRFGQKPSETLRASKASGRSRTPKA